MKLRLKNYSNGQEVQIGQPTEIRGVGSITVLAVHVPPELSGWYADPWARALIMARIGDAPSQVLVRPSNVGITIEPVKLP